MTLGRKKHIKGIDKDKTREPDTASQAEEQAGRLGDKLGDKTGEPGE